MATIRKIYSNFVAGVNTNVSPLLAPDNSTYSQNGVVTSYKLGAAMKDLGYQRVGNVAQSGKSITGLFDYSQTPTIQKTLITMNDSGDADTQLFYNNAGTWTEIGAAETAWSGFEDATVEMEMMLNYCFFVGTGDGATSSFLPVGSLVNTTFSTSTNVTDMPPSKYIKRYRDRLYVANSEISFIRYNYRTYFSSVPSGVGLGTITWDQTTGFFDVDYAAGHEITGLGQNWDLLIIFTKRNAFYYNQNEKKHLWAVGCDNHRTIKNQGTYMLWANRDGVWLSQNAGEPQNIAGNVIDFIRNGNATTFFAEIVDEEYNLYVGTVTVNGVTYTNTLLTFNIPTASWRSRELAHNLTIMAKIDSSGDDRLYMGDTSGNVWNKSKYTDATTIHSDGDIAGVAGSNIHGSFETRMDPMDDPRALKKIKAVTVYAEKGQNAHIQMKTVDNNTRGVMKYKPLGTLNKYINHFEGLDENFNLLQFQVVEYSTLPHFSVFAIEVEYEVIGYPSNTK